MEVVNSTEISMCRALLQRWGTSPAIFIEVVFDVLSPGVCIDDGLYVAFIACANDIWILASTGGT